MTNEELYEKEHLENLEWTVRKIFKDKNIHPFFKEWAWLNLQKEKAKRGYYGEGQHKFKVVIRESKRA